VSDITIWHNPRCSKSRATLALLEAEGHAPRVRRYLDEPPSAEEIAVVLDALGAPPFTLVRTCEPEFATAGIGPQSDAAAVSRALAAHPRLIERPVVICGARAAIGRPPEAVRAILPAPGQR